MNTLQQGGTEPFKQRLHCCFVAYRCLPLLFATGLTLSGLAPNPVKSGEKSDELHEFAQVYVNEYHEPDPSLLLSEAGKNKGEALAYYSHGRKLENQGRTDEAIAAYRKALELHPSARHLARKTAHLMARNNMREEGLKILKQNLAKNPDAPFAHISLSEFYATYYSGEKEKQDLAISLMEAALKKFPDEASVYEQLVRLYLVANRREDAREIINMAGKRTTGDPQFWLRTGALAIRLFPIPENAKNSEPVVLNEFFKKALACAGGDVAIMERVGDYFRATKQFDAALDVFQKIIKTRPDRLQVRKKLALTYAGMQNEKKLIETLQAILAIDKSDVGTHSQIIRIYERRNELLKAIPHYKAILRINNERSDAFVKLARMMVTPTKEGQAVDPQLMEEAVKLLDHAAYLFPDKAEIPELAARILSSSEKWKEAVKRKEAALKIAEKNNPKMLNEYFYFGFAAAVERTGDIARGEKLFRKTIELISRNGQNQEENGMRKKFIAQTYNYLGYMWLENNKNIDEAGEMIKTAIDLDPDSGAIADSIGWFYFKKGRYDEAKKELLRAEKMMEEPDGVIFDHIGQALFHAGDKMEAVKYMEKAVKMDPEKKEFAERLKEYQADQKKVEARPKPKPSADVPPVTPPAKKPGKQ